MMLWDRQSKSTRIRGPGLLGLIYEWCLTMELGLPGYAGVCDEESGQCNRS